MHRPTPQRGKHTKIFKTRNKTRGISARIGRTFKETAAIFGKTTETCEQTVRIFDKTKGPFVMTGNNYSMMNTLGPAPNNSNRTGKISVTTVKISKPIDGICTRIDRPFKETIRIGEPTSMSPVAARNIGQAIVNRARFAIRQ